MENKMGIIFTHLKPDVWQYKVASTLRKKDIRTISISLFSFNRKMFNNAFDEIICLELPNLKPKSILVRFLKNPISFFKFFSKIKKIKANAAIVQGAPFWLTSYFLWLFKTKFPCLFFPYDWNSSMYKDIKSFIPYREIWGEKYSTLNCDAIIHKNDMKELDFLPKSFKIKDKPILQFSCYPYSDWFVSYLPKKKLSYRDKQIHLVYVGFFCDIPHQTMFYYPKKILRQGIHLHIYSNDKLTEEQISKITDNKKELKDYLHIHEYVSPNNLSCEIAKYDFGIFYTEFSGQALPKVASVGFGNKRSSYFEALIPIITYKDFAFINHDIKRGHLGFIISNFKNLKKHVIKFNYKKSIKNISKFREENSVEKNINRLIEFIKQLK